MSMKMSVEGKTLLVVQIEGIWRRAELVESQAAIAQIMGEQGKASVLVLLVGFKGWDGRDEWGDVSFMVEHGDDIEKIAVVGDERWRDEALVFAGAGLRRSPVRYFNDSASARAWLGEGAAGGQ